MTSRFLGHTLGEALRTSPLAPLETRILLCHTLDITRVQLITQSERVLDAAEAARLDALVARREAGEPVAYLIGMREFFGLPFQVTPDVLIPRPETELLVELALERLPPAGHLLDMGTGSGAIAVTVAHTRPDASVAALDASEPALQVARANAIACGVTVDFRLSDWYAGLDATARYDVIASNPPYIMEGDHHLSEGDLRFEPIDALTDHADGLSDLRTLVKGAQAHLKPGGWLLMEHGYDQSAAVRALLTNQGFSDVQSWADLAGIERVTGGRVA